MPPRGGASRPEAEAEERHLDPWRRRLVVRVRVRVRRRLGLGLEAEERHVRRLHLRFHVALPKESRAAWLGFG